MAAPDLYCKYNYSGHCKYELTYHKRRLSETCSDFPCNAKNCEKRHPYLCRYFENFRKCKFGDECSYLHRENQSHMNLKDIEMLKEEIRKLKMERENLEKFIHKLSNIEKEIENLRESLEECKTNELPLDTDQINENLLNDNHRCDICDLDIKIKSWLENTQKS